MTMDSSAYKVLMDARDEKLVSRVETLLERQLQNFLASLEVSQQRQLKALGAQLQSVHLSGPLNSAGCLSPRTVPSRDLPVMQPEPSVASSSESELHQPQWSPQVTPFTPPQLSETPTQEFSIAAGPQFEWLGMSSVAVVNKPFKASALISQLDESQAGDNESLAGNLESASWSVQLESKLHASSPEPTTKIQRLRGSRCFELFWFFAIIASAVHIGVEVQTESELAGNSDSNSTAALTGIGIGFSLLFILELLLRFFSKPRCWNFYMRSSQSGWHLFDTVVAGFCLVDVVFATMLLVDPSSPQIRNVRFVRLLRIVRIMRAVRIVKVARHVAPLRTLLQSIMGTARSLLWAMVLLCILVYIFSIVFTDTVNFNRDMIPPDDESLQLFKSLGQTMLTLLWTVGGGLEWDHAFKVLARISMGWGLLFIVYVYIALFAMLNVMTGVFCQSAIESAQRDHELTVSSLIDHKQEAVKRIEDLFATIDRTRAGGVSVEALDTILQDEWFRSFFSMLGLEPSDTLTLFKLLDRDGDGKIDSSEFLDGCLCLRGNAKAIDLAAVKWESKSLCKEVKHLKTILTRALRHLDRKARPRPARSSRPDDLGRSRAPKTPTVEQPSCPLHLAADEILPQLPVSQRTSFLVGV